jgi:single-strand DNA-binding protein
LRAGSVSAGWQAESYQQPSLITTESFMAGETTITLVGNLTADPELRFTPSGAAVANFTVASTPRTFDRQTNEWRDGEAMFLNCAVWRQAAENVAESLQKGMRVIVHGRLKSRSYETRDGERRTVFEVDVDEIGPALRYATAKVTRNVSGSNQAGPARPAAGSLGDDPWANGTPAAARARSQQGSDPWATPQSDEPPF